MMFPLFAICLLLENCIGNIFIEPQVKLMLSILQNPILTHFNSSLPEVLYVYLLDLRSEKIENSSNTFIISIVDKL